MPHELDLILTLTVGLTTALLFGILTQRLKMSPIVGYLLAGVLIGPFTPGFVADKPLADQLAEIGVILLMFGVGLHFSVGELWAVRKVAIPGALLQILAATALGAWIGTLVGWSLTASIVFGLAISVASTVVLTRVLSDSNELHTPTGHLAVGWLVLEDVFTVLVLVMLPALVGAEGGGLGKIFLSVGGALLKLLVLVAFTMVVGQRVIPGLLEYIAKTRSRELFTLTILVVALGIAVGSSLLFGISMALGAFLAGMVVGQSEFSARAASEALPMRDAFAVLFFVSVGMLLNPAELAANGWMVFGTLGIVLLGKPLAAIVVVWVLKRPLSTAFAVGLALAQIGEFSFILASLGRQLGVLPKEASQVLVVCAIVSITVNPLLFGYRGALARWFSWRRAPLDKGPQPATSDSGAGPEHRAIVVGYGPIGKTLTRLLRENQIEPMVIEMNLDTAKELQRQGAQAIYGDGTHREILLLAGLAHADNLFFTPGGAQLDGAVQLAKEINPDVFILARATYLKEAQVLLKAGADLVVTSEAEVALALTEHLLSRLGATSEQLDRERERVRRDFHLGSPTQSPTEPQQS